MRDFLEERLLHRLEAHRNERLDYGEHRRAVVNRDGELRGDRRRSDDGWLAPL